MPTQNGRNETRPLAIIGMACRFPGEANTPQAFWELLRNEVDAISEVPPDRYDIEYYYHPGGQPGKIITKQGGFLSNIDLFDPSFFGISPREAIYMDPQQRLLLEVTWEALEDAGQVMDEIVGSQTGVFIGIWSNDYGDRYVTQSEDIHFHVLLGSPRYPAAGRISYVFNFQGPSLIVDTACSSSLVALHLACQSLWTGESEMALAGGVNLILDPTSTIGGSQSDILSPDGRCKFGDESANGYVRSEGVGMVVLKPLSQAIADHDPIYAVIRGSAMNNDGRTGGRLSAPGVDAQIDVLREAYQKAGVSPADVSYIEAHGTGTPVGDPIEITALSTIVGENRCAQQPCLIGSAKTNIGHTEAAAGITGIIKAALCLKNKAVPTSIHFNNPNPNIPWSELPFKMQQTYTPWPEISGPAIVGVNSFGITGTNVHVVMEEAPSYPATRDTTTDHTANAYLIPLSAHTRKTLKAVAQTYLDFIRNGQREFSLADFGYTTARRRTHHPYRLTLVARDQVELIEQLEAYLQDEMRPGMATGVKTGAGNPLVFVCSGMGPQWWAMGQELLATEPVFRTAVAACDAYFKPLAGWSLMDELMADEATSRMCRVDVAQTTNFALQVGLAALWRSWGITPDAIVGHSTGEVAAAYLSGILSLPDAVKVTYHRSRLQQLTAGEGKMLAVGLSPIEAKQELVGYEDRVSLGAINSPDSVTLAGDEDALAEIATRLEAKQIFVRFLRTDVPYHSPKMNRLKTELLEVLQGLTCHPPTIATYSTVTGQVADGETFSTAYWWRNVREPVYFAKTVTQIIKDGYQNFVELSPHPVLAGNITQCLHHAKQEGSILSSLNRKESSRYQMLTSLGTLHTIGKQVTWSTFYPTGKFIELPFYPWQRERLWFEEDAIQKGPAHLKQSSYYVTQSHPLLHHYMQSAAHPNTHLWEINIDIKQFPYLKDHRVGEMIVLPGAAWLEIALAAANVAFGQGTHRLADVRFEEVFLLAEDAPRIAQLVITLSHPNKANFQLLSRQDGNGHGETEWTLHATGNIDIQHEQQDPKYFHTPEAIQSQCSTNLSGEDLYRSLAHLVLYYGPTFQGIEHIWQQTEGTLGKLRLYDALHTSETGYHIHPTLLDSAFQVFHGPVAILTQGANSSIPEDAYLPVAIDSLCLYHPPNNKETWCYAQLRPTTEDTDLLIGDMTLFDRQGQIILEVKGLHLEKLDLNGADSVNDWLYDIEWEKKSLTTAEKKPNGTALDKEGKWLILADRQGIGPRIQALLAEQGQQSLIVVPGETFQNGHPDHYQINPGNVASFQELFQAMATQDLRGIIHLWSLDQTNQDQITLSSLAEAQESGAISLLHLVQALIEIEGQQPPLWLVTCGAQPIGLKKDQLPSISQAPQWGLGKVIIQEHPELNFTMVDVSPALLAEEIEALIQEFQSDDNENHIVLRGNGRYVARLVHRTVETAGTNKHVDKATLAPAGDRAFLLQGTPGILDTLLFQAIDRPEPAPGRVRIKVKASGLNFMDLLSALGALPSHANGVGPMGIECAGIVDAVGEGVETVAVGDSVIAIAYNSFASHTTTFPELTVPKPENISYAEAATIPITFLTAHYAIRHQGRLRRGERILIHAAAGGVGMAAVQIARAIGAEIFATAGNPKKRQLLRDLGVQHVMDSRSLDFADEILEITNGEGVDVVLNSLAGAFLLKSIATLGNYGRFLEIGKRDIYQNSQIGLQPFRKNLSFFAVDMDRLFHERPAFAGELFREVMACFQSGAYTPLPMHLFPGTQVAEAFQLMSRARHIGKIVVTMNEPDIRIAPMKPAPITIRPDGTYLITGGLGGLGLAVAEWLLASGATSLVLLSRSGGSDRAQEALATLRETEANITIAKGDVSRDTDIVRVLAEIEQTMPPLRGIVHAAGVLDDATLPNLNRDRFYKVTVPKIEGTWNLHAQTLDKELDFFLLFSSAASLLGTPGQGNYVAANIFLDTIAHYRRAQGLPALSINWGAWSEVGMAAAQANRGERLAAQGIIGLTPKQGINALAHVLNHKRPQIGVMGFDFHKWAQAFPKALEQPLLAHLAEESAALYEHENGSNSQNGNKAIRNELLAAQPEERRGLLEAFLREQLAKVLRLSPSRIDPHTTMQNLGVDSLMSLEIRGRLEAGLGITLSGTMVWNYPTLDAMSTYIATRLGISLETNGDTASDGDETISEEVEEELLKLLEEVEDLPDTVWSEGK